MRFLLGGSCRGAITASSPFLRRYRHSRPNLIQHYITAELQKMAILFDYYRLEASLKNMADTAVAPLECLRVNAVQLVHSLREIAVRSLTPWPFIAKDSSGSLSSSFFL